MEPQFIEIGQEPPVKLNAVTARIKKFNQDPESPKTIHKTCRVQVKITYHAKNEENSSSNGKRQPNEANTESIRF